MTWSAEIKQDCNACENENKNCNIRKVAWPLANVLTAVDVMNDGTMAPGKAVLDCFGFKEKKTAE